MRALANVNANILVQRYVRALDIDIANCANMALCVILIAYTQLESSVGQGGFQPQGSAPAIPIPTAGSQGQSDDDASGKTGDEMPELLIC